MKIAWHTLLIFLAIFVIFFELIEGGKQKPKKKKRGGKTQPNKGQLTAEESADEEEGEGHLAKASSSSDVPAGKDAKGKGLAEGGSFMEKAAEHKQKEKVEYIMKNYQHFNLGNFMDEKKYFEKPENTEQYDAMLKDVLHRLDEEKKTVDGIVELIKKGLLIKGRKVRFIRLIGAGSMRGHEDYYNYYDDDGEPWKLRELIHNWCHSHEGIMKKYGSEEMNSYVEDVMKKYGQRHQLNALYQMALAIRIGERFELANRETTMEDMHLDSMEMEYLRDVHHVVPILGVTEEGGNLDRIPNQVDKMGENEVTLVIMINCPRDMTLRLANSYGSKSGQLILMESSMNSRFPLTSRAEKKELEKVKKMFLPKAAELPATDLAQSFYHQHYVRLYFGKSN